MASDYNPRRFFRQVPNRLLQQYFAAQKVLGELDFASISETQIEPIYQAWLALPESARKNLERDFQGRRGPGNGGRLEGDTRCGAPRRRGPGGAVRLTRWVLRARLLDLARAIWLPRSSAGIQSCRHTADLLLAEAQEHTSQDAQRRHGTYSALRAGHQRLLPPDAGARRELQNRLLPARRQ